MSASSRMMMSRCRLIALFLVSAFIHAAFLSVSVSMNQPEGSALRKLSLRLPASTYSPPVKQHNAEVLKREPPRNIPEQRVTAEQTAELVQSGQAVVMKTVPEQEVTGDVQSPRVGPYPHERRGPPVRREVQGADGIKSDSSGSGRVPHVSRERSLTVSAAEKIEQRVPIERGQSAEQPRDLANFSRSGRDQPDERDEDRVSAYIEELLLLVRESTYYPAIAQRSGIEGTVHVHFLIRRNGDIADISIQQSSGHHMLDRTAVKIIEKTSPAPPPPGAALRLNVPVVFSLRDD